MDSSTSQQAKDISVESFVEHYVKKIVSAPNNVSIQSAVVEHIRNVDLFVSPNDMGRVIGKDGKMISALKTFISGCKAKDGLTYKITVHATTVHATDD